MEPGDPQGRLEQLLAEQRVAQLAAENARPGEGRRDFEVIAQNAELIYCLTNFLSFFQKMSFHAWEIPSESPEILANSMDLCNPRVVVKFWEKLAEIF